MAAGGAARRDLLRGALLPGPAHREPLQLARLRRRRQREGVLPGAQRLRRRRNDLLQHDAAVREDGDPAHAQQYVPRRPAHQRRGDLPDCSARRQDGH